jgi:hypothetical protein
VCSNEDEARTRVQELALQKKWPCYFFPSDTTGEKDFEEFYTDHEVLDMTRFINLGVIKRSQLLFDESQLHMFTAEILKLKQAGTWKREDLIALFNTMIPNFNHKETGKFLDSRM